jgi:hypothetical protein
MMTATVEFHLVGQSINLDDHDFDTIFEDDDLVTRDEFKEEKFANGLKCDLYAYED